MPTAVPITCRQPTAIYGELQLGFGPGVGDSGVAWHVRVLAFTAEIAFHMFNQTQ